MPCKNDVDHFGRPYISAYQLAIEMKRRYPETVAAIGKPVGGAGIGQHNSLAQYLSNELSKQIKQGDEHRVEGAFFSNENATSVAFSGADGVLRAAHVSWDDRGARTACRRPAPAERPHRPRHLFRLRSA